MFKSYWYIGLLLGVLWQASAPAQQSGSVALPQTKNPSVPPNAGGASGANFTQLINLIEDVVPGDWDSDENSITPFPSGVWIDAKGMMHRSAGKATKRFTPNDQTQSKLSLVLGDLQKSQPLRWVSLKDIDLLLSDGKFSDHLSKPSGLLVGGLSKIQYLHWDASRKEWFLGGPAGDFALDENGDLRSQTSNLPPVLLEDFLTIAPLVLNGGAPFGCTIEPSQAGLAHAATELQNAMFIKKLQNDPKGFASALGQTVGQQELKLINLPKGCATGVALLVADEHMKRLGLELADKPKVQLTTYWKAAAKQNKQSAKTLVRWWFALAQQPIAQLPRLNSGNLDFVLDRPTVRVQSQSEWMQDNGQRVAQEDRDPAADAFAASFSENFEALQKQYTFYGRLGHIFDIAVAFEMVRREAEADPSKLPVNLSRWDYKNQQAVPLATIDSLVGVKKLKNSSISAVVSGGVLVEVKELQTRKTVTESARPDSKNIKQFKLD